MNQGDKKNKKTMIKDTGNILPTEPGRAFCDEMAKKILKLDINRPATNQAPAKYIQALQNPETFDPTYFKNAIGYFIEDEHKVAQPIYGDNKRLYYDDLIESLSVNHRGLQAFNRIRKIAIEYCNEKLEELKRLYTYDEAATYMRCSKVFIRQQRKEGKLRSISVGRKVLFQKFEIDEFLKKIIHEVKR